MNIYKSRIADLLRIASNGSGILPEGELHPDLVERLAQEASKSAGHTLNMCIRALDYCPPMDITFGDFLRAIITADSDLVQEDDRNYRLAFIDAFRKRGIYPEGIRTLSEDSLRYTDLDIGYIDKDEQIASTRLSAVIDPETQRLLGIIYKFLRGYGDVIKYITDRKEIYEKTRDYIAGKYVKEGEVIMGLHARIGVKFNNSNAFSQITGLAFVGHYADLGIRKSRRSTGPRFQIQNLRLVSRVGPGNRQVNQVVFSIAMHSTVKLDGDTPVFYEFPVPKKNEPYTHHEIPEGFVELSGGCTLIFDLDHLKLRYAVSKPLLETGAEGNPSINMTRLKRLVNFYQQNFANEFESYFSSPGQMNLEPFAFLHQH